MNWGGGAAKTRKDSRSPFTFMGIDYQGQIPPSFYSRPLSRDKRRSVGVPTRVTGPLRYAPRTSSPPVTRGRDPRRKDLLPGSDTLDVSTSSTYV